MLAAEDLTGDERYMTRARELADMAVAIFFDGSPLPRASSKHGHYEAITRGDTLVMALLNLWARENRPSLNLAYNER